MKRFFQFIEQTTGEKWDYMKKPNRSIPAVPAVDEYGREIKTPTLPKKQPKEVPEKDPTVYDPDREPRGVINKNWKRLQDAPPGTEDRAEYKMRKEYRPDSINMLPRRVGPETNPEKEQNDTVDHQVLKKDTQDQMPEINVDEPPQKIRKRT